MAKKAFITINSDKFMHISIGTAAEYLGVSTSTLRRWDQQNILKPTYRTVGKHRNNMIHFDPRSSHRLTAI